MKLIEAHNRMDKCLDYLYEQVKGLRYGAITPSLVDTVKIAVGGQQVPIKYIAATSRAGDGISVVPYDPSLTGQIAAALKNAGFNAYVFSKTTVQVSVPTPCGEDKEKVRKRLRELGEEAKVAVRNVRKKAKAEMTDFSVKELQDLTDRKISMIDELIKDRLSRI